MGVDQPHEPEKARLEIEREQLANKLGDIEAQLKALGIEEGAAGITQVIGQLYEQRAAYQARFERTKEERDALPCRTYPL